MPTEKELEERFGLEPLAMEGGMFRRTWESPVIIPASALGGRFPADKRAGSAILYMVTPSSFSRLHRLPTDEVYHFYLGDPVRMLMISPEGEVRCVVLGQDVMAGMEVQLVVPAFWWQGLRLADGGRVALLGTTMAPAFDDGDYEDGDGDELSRLRPDWEEEIRRLSP